MVVAARRPGSYIARHLPHGASLLGKCLCKSWVLPGRIVWGPGATGRISVVVSTFSPRGSTCKLEPLQAQLRTPEAMSLLGQPLTTTRAICWCCYISLFHHTHFLGGRVRDWSRSCLQCRHVPFFTHGCGLVHNYTCTCRWCHIHNQALACLFPTPLCSTRHRQ